MHQTRNSMNILSPSEFRATILFLNTLSLSRLYLFVLLKSTMISLILYFASLGDFSVFLFSETSTEGTLASDDTPTSKQIGKEDTNKQDGLLLPLFSDSRKTWQASFS